MDSMKIKGQKHAQNTGMRVKLEGVEGVNSLDWQLPTNVSQAAPKPKFLPYLTKKTPIANNFTENKPSSQPGPTKLPLNFVQVVSPPTIQPPSAPRTKPPTPDTPPILHLPFEIWHLITAHLPQSTLAALTLTHSTLHTLITPHLYHTINLTDKNDPIRWSYRSHLTKSQFLFIKHILTHPHLALHVKNFYWEMGLDRMGLIRNRIRGEEVVWRDEDLFAMFALLKNVVVVDIGTGLRSHGILPKEMEGKPLFPKARCVSLGGTMRREFLEAVLLGQPRIESNENWEGKEKETSRMAQLKTLILDDLEEETAPPAARFMNRRAYTASRTQAGQTDVLILGPCQPMQHVLTPALYSRCRDLTSLSIRVRSMSERGTSDDELWAEWAVFIQEMEPKQVMFDCDRRLKKYKDEHGCGSTSASSCAWSRAQDQRGRAGVANGRRFGETLLPVLKNGWDGLERVEVHGIGDSVAKELEILKDKGVEVVFDEDNESGCGRYWQ